MFDNIWNIVILLLGGIIGLTFADIDLAPPLPIKHRSAWTHGPIVPLSLAYLSGSYPWLWWAAVGFLPAFCLHLLADMFPKGWRGGAKINLFPIPFSLPALFSFLFLAGTIYFSLVTWKDLMGVNFLGDWLNLLKG